MKQLEEANWTLSEFLYALFRTKDRQGNDIKIEKSLETSLSMFLCGRTLHTPIEIVELWMKHPFSSPSTTEEYYEPLYSFNPPYLQVKHARAAITSMAAQLVKKEMVAEAKRAVKGSNGLHGSYPRAKGHGKTLGWSDIGSHTFGVVQKILARLQPLTLHLLTSVATPKPRKDSVQPDRVRRPPHLVGGSQLLRLCNS